VIYLKELHMASFILVVIGAVNWGLVGLMNFNVVATIFGTMPTIERLIYLLVGASGVYLAATHMSDCKMCSKKSR
jgi:uncharacterized membrane protein YuzA (DUF378 family)